MQSNKPFSKLNPPTQPIGATDLMMISQETPEGWMSGKVDIATFLDQIFGVGGPGYGKLTEFEERLDSLEDRVDILENNASAKDLAEAIFHIGSKHMTDKLDWNPGRDLVGILGYETNWLLYPYIPAGVVSENSNVGDLVSISSATTGASVNSRRLRIWERLDDGEVTNQYRLISNRSQINEGDAVTYTLITAGVDSDTKIKYTITGVDQLDIENPLSGEFITGSDGTATLIVLSVTDRRTDGDKFMKITLNDFTSVSSTVKILDTSQAPAGLTTVAEGTNQNIPLGPMMQAEIWIIAGGGGGGGSIYLPIIIPPDGDDGHESYVTVSNKNARANPGKKGIGGAWEDSTSPWNGSAGAGGTAEIITTSSTELEDVEIQITTLQKGLDALEYNRWSDQLGADGSADHFGIRRGGGGNGAWSIGNEGGYGGAGGAGAFIKMIVKNRSDDTIQLFAAAGAGGKGWNSGGNAGLDGKGGVVQAMISSLPAGDDGTLEFIYPSDVDSEIVISDYEIVEIWVVSAGGGGAGLASTTAGASNTNMAGQNGGDSYLLINDVKLIAGGAIGGAGGLVGMGGGANGLGGNTRVEGPAGSGSYNEHLIDPEIPGVMTGQTAGKQRNRTSPVAQQLGAEALSVENMGAFGGGGNGSSGNSTLHTGGAGGSGALFKYTVTNRTPVVKRIKARAGRAGKAGVGQTELDYMQGLPGDNGIIIIRRKPLVNYDNQIIERTTAEKIVYIPAGKLVAFGLAAAGGGSGGINNTGINTTTNDGSQGGDTRLIKWGIAYKAEGGHGGLSAKWSGSSPTENPSTPTLGGDVFVNSIVAIPVIPPTPVGVPDAMNFVLYSAVKGGSSSFNGSSLGGSTRRIIRDTLYGDGANGVTKDIMLANPTFVQSAAGGAGGTARGFIYNSGETLLDIPVEIGSAGNGALNPGTTSDGVHSGLSAKDGVAHAGVVDYLKPQNRRHNANIRDLFIPPNRAMRVKVVASGGAGAGYRIKPTDEVVKTAPNGVDSWVRIAGLTYTAKAGKGGKETIYTEANGVIAGVGGLGGVVEVNGVALVNNTIVANPAVTLPTGVSMTMTVATAGASGSVIDGENGGTATVIAAEDFGGGGNGAIINDPAGTDGWTNLIGGGGGSAAYFECLIVNNSDQFLAVEAGVGRSVTGLSSEGASVNTAGGNSTEGYITTTLEDAPENGTFFHMVVGLAPALPGNIGAADTVLGYNKNLAGATTGTYDGKKITLNGNPMEVTWCGLRNDGQSSTPAFGLGFKDWFFGMYATFMVEIENLTNGYRVQSTSLASATYLVDAFGSDNATAKETLRGWIPALNSWTWVNPATLIDKIFITGDRLKVKVVQLGYTGTSVIQPVFKDSDSDSAETTISMVDTQVTYVICKLPTDIKDQRIKVDVIYDGTEDVIDSLEFTNVARMVYPYTAVAPVSGSRLTKFVWSVYNPTTTEWTQIALSSISVSA